MDAEERRIIELLVSFETTPTRSNRPLIDWVADYLDGLAVNVDVLPSEDGSKANLVARIGPEVPGGLVLSGHTDVVTVDGQDWTVDPFKVTEKHGRLYGRGTADMKAFVALAVALAPWFAALPLKRPIFLALSYDEETGCQGAPALVEHIATTFPLPDIAIIGEPTGMAPTIGHKGMHLFRTTVEGKEAHSSMPAFGASANVAAGKLIAFLDRYFARTRERYPENELFDPPYCTFNIGRLDGGVATSIIPNRCYIDWEFRTVPGISAQSIIDDIQAYVESELVAELRRTHSDANVDLNCWAQVPALEPQAESKAATLVRRLTGRDENRIVSFATEAGIYQQAGISAVLCGPGEIAQAHRHDEYISLGQVDACAELLRKIGEWASGPNVVSESLIA